MDERTLRFYDGQAEAYAEMAAGEAADGPANARLVRFAAALPPGARVLDFGCGSAWAAAWLRDRGFPTDALDASAGLAAEAARRHGIAVRVAPFEALDADAAYDGIWAAFCLLHAPLAELPAHLGRLARALRPGGLLYLGMKEGEGERRDRLGRRYAYVSEALLRDALAAAGLAVEDAARETGRGYAGEDEVFLHLHASRLRGAPPGREG